MSIVSIRAALETALATISPTLSTAYENAAFTPVTGTPYQRVWLMPAEPDNSEIGANYQEMGLMQIDLHYPKDSGPAAAAARVALIRSKFKRATSFSSGGVIVTIQRTPEAIQSQEDADTYKLPVRVRWFANITA